MSRMKTSLVLCFFALIVVGCAGPTVGTGTRTSGDIPSGEKWGPSTSVPQIYMTPEGDRVGHYAPYFYPDGTSGGEKR
jgi:hypothetical protein